MGQSEQEFYERLQGAEKTAPTAPSEGSKMEEEILKADPEAGTPVTIRNLFTHGEAHPIVLDFALIRAFGTDWMFWEPETIWGEVMRTFKSSISEHARAKINTIKTIHVADGPWEHWQVTEKIIQGLNGNIPHWDVQQVPTLPQLFAAMDILEKIRVRDFHDEVRAYLAAVVLHEEVTFVPPPLDFLQLEVSRPTYKCKDCGNVENALHHDGICSSCAGKFDPEQGLSMRPNPEKLAAGRGKNLEMLLTTNPAAVAKRWVDVMHKPTHEVLLLEDNEVDAQIGRLLDSRDYLNVRRRQLVDQLKSLRSWLGSSP